MKKLLPLTLLLASCGEQVTCPSCNGDGKQRCTFVIPNPDQVKCENGTVRCDPSVHDPKGPTGFCTVCLGKDGQSHGTCEGTGIRKNDACDKCDGSGKVRQ